MQQTTATPTTPDVAPAPTETQAPMFDEKGAHWLQHGNDVLNIGANGERSSNVSVSIYGSFSPDLPQRGATVIVYLSSSALGGAIHLSADDAMRLAGNLVNASASVAKVQAVIDARTAATATEGGAQ